MAAISATIIGSMGNGGSNNMEMNVEKKINAETMDIRMEFKNRNLLLILLSLKKINV